MRRDARILLATVALGAAAEWGGRIPSALSELDTFHISDIQVRGLRYLSPEEVVARLDLAPETSVWTDKGALVERLRADPMILDASVTRRVPDGLLVRVVERRPIALAPTPTLEPVDAQGHRLPLDPSKHRLDLPIIASSRVPPAGSRLFTEDVRELAAEVDHLMNADTAFLQRVSSVRRDRRGTLVVRWTEPPVEFLLPSRASPARLREGLGALTNAISLAPGAMPSQIDLRYADQVVVRRGRRR